MGTMHPGYLAFLLAFAASAPAAPDIEYAISTEECDGNPIRKSTLRMEFTYGGDSAHPTGYSTKVISETGEILSTVSSNGFPDNGSRDQVGKSFVATQFAPNSGLPFTPTMDEKQTEVSGETFLVIRYYSGAPPGSSYYHYRSFASEYAPLYVYSTRPYKLCSSYTMYRLKEFHGKPVDSSRVAGAEMAITKAFVGVRKTRTAASAQKGFAGPEHRADGRRTATSLNDRAPIGPTFRNMPR